MGRVKVLFWIILAVFLCAIIYGSLFFSPRYKESTLDPSKISIQTFLNRSPDKIPKEVSISLNNFQKEVALEDYEGLKSRNLFGRYQVKQSPPKVQTTTPLPVEEEQPPVFTYQGIVMIGAKQVVILLEPEKGRSFFVGKGDRFRIGHEKTEYELIDIQQDEVILFKIGQKPQKVIIPKKKP